MKSSDLVATIAANDVRIALYEIFPDASYGSIPIADQCDAVEAYRAFESGALEDIPNACAAFLECKRRNSL